MLQMLSSSQESVGFRVIGGWLTSALASLGPILLKYLQNLSAISTGYVIVLPSDSNDEGWQR